MGISFKGHTPDYNFWVFDIDGKTFLARNNSTQSPLRLNFKDGRFFGNYSIDKIIPGAVLVKISGFDIISGTSQTSGNSAGMVLNGIVEWTWAGQKYRNRWTLTEGMELSPAIPEEGVEGTYAYDLDIQPPYTPYDGPAGGAVGTGVASQAVIETSTRQIVPSAQLSTAAPEQQYPLPMSVTSKPVNTGIASPAAIQAAQSGAMTKDEREDAERRMATTTPSASYGGPSGSGYVQPVNKPVNTGIVSKTVIDAQKGGYAGPSGSGYTQPSGSGYSGPSGSNYPGPSGGGGGGGSTPRKVTTVFEPSKPYGGPSGSLPADTAAGPDWVKLALQVGTAYLLLS
jgi:hypothetical protein